MATLTCSIIAKDEEQLLPNLLKTITPLVDEVVIAIDTKSQDKTKEIAETAAKTDTKIKVFDYEWKDDFAAARNFTITKSTKEWILFLDADERFAKKDVEDLKKVLNQQKEKESKEQERNKENATEEVVAFSFLQRYYTKEKDKTAYANWKPIKNKDELTKEFPEIAQFDGSFDIFPLTHLIKNHEKIRFSGPVHEDVQPSIAQWGKEEPKKVIVHAPIPIHHFHFIKNKKYEDTKQAYYFKLSKEKFKTHPDAKIALDIAAGYLAFEKNQEQAFHFLIEAVKFQNLEEARLKRMQLLVEKKQYIAALHEIMVALDVKKHNPNDIFNIAKALYKMQAYRAAIIVIKRLFIHAPREQTLIEYLGVCYDKIKFTKDAIQVFEHGITIYPTNAIFYFNLGALYEKENELGKAVGAFQYAINNNHPKKAGLPQRIAMLRKKATGQHVTYNVNVGNTSE